jgi:hypothetical protein
VVADNSVGEDDASLEPDAGANLGAGADDDVRANHGSGVNLGGLCVSVTCAETSDACTHGVDQDVTTVDPFVLGGVGEQGRVLRGEVGEVEAGT